MLRFYSTHTVHCSKKPTQSISKTSSIEHKKIFKLFFKTIACNFSRAFHDLTVNEDGDDIFLSIY